MPVFRREGYYREGHNVQIRGGKNFKATAPPETTGGRDEKRLRFRRSVVFENRFQEFARALLLGRGEQILGLAFLENLAAIEKADAV